MAKSKLDIPETKQKPHHALFEHLKRLEDRTYTHNNLDISVRVESGYSFITVKSPDEREEHIKYDCRTGALEYELFTGEAEVKVDSVISPKTSFQQCVKGIRVTLKDIPPYQPLTKGLLYDFFHFFTDIEREKNKASPTR